MIEVNILSISTASLLISWKCLSSRNPVLLRSLSQYWHSLHSLREICNLAIKSFFDCPFMASWTFAPIDVPLFNNCVLKLCSQSILAKFLFKLTILTAKLKVFSWTILFVIISFFTFLIFASKLSTLFLNSQLLTLNSQL